MKLENSVIVITGGARGLGKSMAEMLNESKAKLAIIDLDQSAAHKTASFLDNARGYGADISNESQVDNVFKRISSDFSRIDVLVNNAGILQDGLTISKKEGVFKKLAAEKFQSVLNVNLTGSFLCGQAAAAHMIEQQSGGVIINISSISRAGNFGQSNYSASKAGVAALTTTWAKEFARHQIRSAAIAPGFIATDMTDSMPPDVLEKLTKQIPVGRMGRAEEIAMGVKFIIENDYFNGRVLEIDGGMRL